MAATDPFPLPRGWKKSTRSCVLHAISLAFVALTRAWGSSATSGRRTTRLQADRSDRPAPTGADELQVYIVNATGR